MKLSLDKLLCIPWKLAFRFMTIIFSYKYYKELQLELEQSIIYSVKPLNNRQAGAQLLSFVEKFSLLSEIDFDLSQKIYM